MTRAWGGGWISSSVGGFAVRELTSSQWLVFRRSQAGYLRFAPVVVLFFHSDSFSPKWRNAVRKGRSRLQDPAIPSLCHPVLKKFILLCLLLVAHATTQETSPKLSLAEMPEPALGADSMEKAGFPKGKVIAFVFSNFKVFPAQAPHPSLRPRAIRSFLPTEDFDKGFPPFYGGFHRQRQTAQPIRSQAFDAGKGCAPEVSHVSENQIVR